jgi:uncharacterized membrane protein
MSKGRVEAFTDGVIAIIITIMVLELMPFVIRWIGEAGIVAAPVAAYGVTLTGAAISYVLLQQAIIAGNPDSVLPQVIGSDWKGKSSIVAYLVAIPLAFWHPWPSIALYVAVAAMWFIPDRRIERTVAHEDRC